MWHAQAAMPKQYLDLLGQPIAMYSLQVFATMPEVLEIVVVCNQEYRWRVAGLLHAVLRQTLN